MHLSLSLVTNFVLIIERNLGKWKNFLHVIETKIKITVSAMRGPYPQADLDRGLKTRGGSKSAVTPGSFAQLYDLSHPQPKFGLQKYFAMSLSLFEHQKVLSSLQLQAVSFKLQYQPSFGHQTSQVCYPLSSFYRAMDVFQLGCTAVMT